MAHFKLDFAWTSAITLRAVVTACARSTSIVLGILGSTNQLSEGNSPNMSAVASYPPGPSISLHALTAMLSRN